MEQGTWETQTSAKGTTNKDGTTGQKLNLALRTASSEQVAQRHELVPKLGVHSHTEFPRVAS